MIDNISSPIILCVVEVQFADDHLARLETDERYGGGLDQAIVRAFRKRMQQIRAAPDERTFFQLKSLHFEKLRGGRAGQYSMRLNDQLRLTMEFRGTGSEKIVISAAIEDYHR